MEFIKGVKEDITLGKVKSNYDAIFETEAMNQHVRNKQIQ